MEGNKTPLQLDQQNILPGNIQNIISKNRNPVFNTETGTSHHITYNIKIKKYEAILDIQNNDDTEHVARSKMALRYNTKMQKNHYAWRKGPLAPMRHTFHQIRHKLGK